MPGVFKDGACELIESLVVPYVQTLPAGHWRPTLPNRISWARSISVGGVLPIRGFGGHARLNQRRALLTTQRKRRCLDEFALVHPSTVSSGISPTLTGWKGNRSSLLRGSGVKRVLSCISGAPTPSDSVQALPPRLGLYFVRQKEAASFLRFTAAGMGAVASRCVRPQARVDL